MSKRYNTYVVLVYSTGMKSNIPLLRLRVGAKNPKNAEVIAGKFLADNRVKINTKPPRTYYEVIDEDSMLDYKEIVVDANRLWQE